MTPVVLPTDQPPPGELQGRWRLGHEPASAGLARRLVVQTIVSGAGGGSGADHDGPDHDGPDHDRTGRGGGTTAASDALQRRAALATGELLANAVLHARPPLDLEVRRTERGWLVAVSDGDRQAPTPRVADLLSESGRGWLIIDRATERYGWAPGTPESPGKTVWVELWER